jgi:hypothetical protein
MSLWSTYLILYCFGDERRPSYLALGLTGLVLGLTLSQRPIGAYLVLLVPALAIGLPAAIKAPEMGLLKSLLEEIVEKTGAVSFLFLVALATYVLAMPAILTDFGFGPISRITSTFSRYHWPGYVRYFGINVSAQHIPWHYVYGFFLAITL